MVNIIEGHIIYFIYRYVSQIWGFLTMRDPNITPNLWIWIGTTIAISNPILRNLKSRFHWAKPRILKLKPYETICEICGYPAIPGKGCESPWSDFEWQNSRKNNGLNVNIHWKTILDIISWWPKYPQFISIFLMVKLPYSKRCFISQQLIGRPMRCSLASPTPCRESKASKPGVFFLIFPMGHPPFEGNLCWISANPRYRWKKLDASNYPEVRN